jgi:hypothetical protein
LPDGAFYEGLTLVGSLGLSMAQRRTALTVAGTEESATLVRRVWQSPVLLGARFTIAPSDAWQLFAALAAGVLVGVGQHRLAGTVASPPSETRLTAAAVVEAWAGASLVLGPGELVGTLRARDALTSPSTFAKRPRAAAIMVGYALHWR